MGRFALLLRSCAGVVRDCVGGRYRAHGAAYSPQQRGRQLAYMVIIGYFLAVLPSTLLARQGTPPLSSSQATTPLSAVPIVEFPTIDPKALLTEGDKTNDPGPMRFAVPVEVEITPDSAGVWEQLPDGGRLWRLRFYAPGATDLNFGFTRYWLPDGATLHIISESEEYYEGPYTAQDNKGHGQLWTPVVPGDRAMLELYVPAAAEAAPELQLTQVNLGYRDLFKRQSQSKVQGACNIDVICPEGNNWRDQIRSVARYSIAGTGLCTGSLVMDVPRSFRPFFLSAAHCGVTAGNAASLVVYWNFEAPTCGQRDGGSLAQNQSGATFRASKTDVDMLLVELDSSPAVAFNVFYSGWDRSGTAPPGSVGIHHPSGEEKSISFNDDALTTSNSCIGSGGVNTHWRVDNWEQGTTEPGSSGSGLWHPTTRRLVGFLSGGQAACTNPTGFDCYGKFSVAWNSGGTAATRLRDWLDPSNNGATTIDGEDPPAADFPVAIPDQGRVAIALEITENISVGDVNVFVDIQHTFVGDLRLVLRSPAGTDVVLLARPGVPASDFGCGNNNMEVTFDDDATTELEDHCAGTTPWYSGTALPFAALEAFNGELATGTWTLIVTDNAEGDTGSVIEWRLTISSTGSSPRLAVLGHHPSTEVARVFIKNSVTGAASPSVNFGSTYTPIALATLPDRNGNGAPELAMLGRHPTTGVVRVFIRDSVTGAASPSVNFGSTYTPVALTPLELP